MLWCNTASFGTKRTAYFRLHGFGKTSMYGYDFSTRELESVKELVESLSGTTSHVYVFFNNVTCYHNARMFLTMMNTLCLWVGFLGLLFV